MIPNIINIAFIVIVGGIIGFNRSHFVRNQKKKHTFFFCFACPNKQIKPVVLVFKLKKNRFKSIFFIIIETFAIKKRFFFFLLFEMLKFCLFSILIFVSIVAAINHSAIDGVAVRRKVILDLDTAGLVEGGFDVDDDLALLIALGSREIEIVAITVTYGNAPLEQTLANAKLLCRMANISEESVPIAGGVSWLTRSLLPSNASRLIEQTVLKHDGQVHIIAVGPVTNVAAALHNNKQLENSIASITVMGGDLSPTSIRPFHLHIDLNFMSHRDAINVVLQANVPKLIVTIQTCIAVCRNSIFHLFINN